MSRIVTRDESEYVDPNGEYEITENMTEQQEGPQPAVRQNQIIYVVKKNKGWLACVLIGVVLLLFLIGFLYWGRFDWYQGHNDHHMHQLEVKLNGALEAQRQSQRYATSGLYSLAAAFATRSEYGLSLCHQDDYGTSTVNKIVHLVPSDASRRAIALAQKSDRSLQPGYPTHVRLEMRYNVDLGPEAQRKLKMQEGELCETLHYELSSSYTAFSGVRLLVSTEDIYRGGQPTLIQEVLICSNRPGSGRLCSGRDGMLLMNDSLVMPVELPAVEKENNKKNATTRSETQISAPPKSEQEDEMGMDLESATKTQDTPARNLRLLESQIANNRMFDLIFYQETTPEEGRDNSASDYSEYIVLTIRPTECN